MSHQKDDKGKRRAEDRGGSNDDHDFDEDGGTGMELGYDDILGQITSKLSTINMAERSDEVVQAFISVLMCTVEEANFYLESAEWEIGNAISLYLDTQQFRHRGHKRLQHPQYEPKQIIIEGLPSDWIASVHELHGSVVFTHIPSGNIQTEIPQPFYDYLRQSSASNNNHNNNSTSETDHASHSSPIFTREASMDGSVVDNDVDSNVNNIDMSESEFNTDGTMES